MPKDEKTEKKEKKEKKDKKEPEDTSIGECWFVRIAVLHASRERGHDI